MKTELSKTLILVVVFVMNVVTVMAQDWPQYLGPNRNSITDQDGLLRTWPAEGPETLWTVNVGIGYGGPVIREGKAYLLDRDDEVGDKLRCFDLSSGEELWKFEYDAPGAVMFPGSRSVPAIDGNNIYSCGPFGDLYCIDVNTHKPVWNVNIWTDFGGIPGGGGSEGGFGNREEGSFPIWAITQCPLVYKDLLIVASQAPEAGVVAFDKLTGAIKWKTPSLGDVGYVSPSIVKIDGEDHVVMVTAAKGRRGEQGTGGKVVGIHANTGDVLWEYGAWQCRIPAPTVIDATDGKILIIGGYEAGAELIQVGKNNSEGFDVTGLIKTVEFGAHTKPAVFYNDFFYAQYSTNERRDGLVCMNMDGEIMWKTKRDPLFDKGSMILVNGLILATDGNKSLFLIEPDPNEFKPLASVELLEPGQNWAPIALADGKLLIRDQKKMMCMKVAE